MNSAAIWQYLGIFAMLVAAGLGVPIPEEIPVVTGGVMSAHPELGLHWWIMLPICILGVVISDGLLYGVGRLWGPRLLEYPWVKTRLMPPARQAEIQGNFHKYGVKILLFARVLPGIRAPIFITAGIMRLSFAKFLLADGIYAIPGVSLLFFLGWWFTDQFLEVVQRVENIRPLIVVVVITVVGTYLFIRFVKRPVATGAPDELPPVVSQMTHMVAMADEVVMAGIMPDGVKGRPDKDTMTAIPMPEPDTVKDANASCEESSVQRTP